MRGKSSAGDLPKHKRWVKHCVFSLYDFNHGMCLANHKITQSAKQWRSHFHKISVLIS